jgi:glutamate dehydrogenase
MAIALAPRVYGLDAICAAALQTGGGEDVAHFARRVFGRVADKDLAAAPAEQRAQAATSLLAFARRRLPGVAKVRVFNPSAAAHGFDSRHTIVQIVNDDMPFLVDRSPTIQSPRDRRPPAGPSRAGGAARPRRRSSGHRGRGRRAGAIRIDDGISRSTARPIPRRSTNSPPPLPACCRGAAGGRGLAADATRLPRCHRRSRAQPVAPTRRVRRFLRWLEANHFTFPGHRHYRYVDDAAQRAALRYELIPGSALGILRRDEVRLFEAGLQR